jgi:hypothetical protein
MLREKQSNFLHTFDKTQIPRLQRNFLVVISHISM